LTIFPAREWEKAEVDGKPFGDPVADQMARRIEHGGVGLEQGTVLVGNERGHRQHRHVGFQPVAANPPNSGHCLIRRTVK